MRREWKGAAFMLMAVCVTALVAQTPATPAPSTQQEGPVFVTVDCAKVVNTMRGGLGASWHAMETPIPYGVKHPVFSGYSHGGSGWGAYPPAQDERAWQQIYRHAEWLGLDWNRVEVEQRIYEPERDAFTFDSPEMRILYRILDWHQRSGAEVFFQQMWCNAAWLAYPEFRDDPVGRVHSAPVDVNAFADGLTTLMEHLIKKRGYTCIKWLCITNEPGANFSWWQAPPNQPLSIGAGLAAVRKALDQRGLKLPLSGPDTTTGFPAQTPGALDSLGLLGAYDFHDYGADFDFRTKGHIAAQERNAAQWVDLAHREGKPLFLSEFGTMAYGWVPDKPGPSSPPSVLAGSELVVRLANTGVDGFNRWSFLNRGDLDGQWQLVDTWDPQAKKLRADFGPHPNGYFCLGLLSRFTAQHPAILSSHVKGGKLDDWQRVFCAAFRSPMGNLTLAVVNDASAEFPLKLALQALPKPERFYRYRYGKAQQDRADVTVNPEAEFSLTPEANELKDTLPATSLTIYSAYKLEHSSPGVITESAGGERGRSTSSSGNDPGGQTRSEKRERPLLPARPNIVFFLADDLGYGDLGCHGNPHVKTPQLDAFAREAVALANFHVSPVCSPTRASLMTGRYNFRTGVCDVFGRGCQMDPAEVTVAEALRSAGYATGIFGKWHLGDDAERCPNAQGFDEALVHTGPALGKYFDPELVHNGQRKKFTGYCMNIFTDHAIDFIRRNRARPFFVYLPANLIHTPLQVSDELAAPFVALGLGPQTSKAYGMVKSVDDSFGRVRATLKELGLEDNTLLLFASDNGPCSGSAPTNRFMAGLHGLKGTVYENGIRVPCFARWPAGFRGPAKVTRLTAHLDVMPTLLDACGIAAPSGVKLDGASLLPLLRNPATGLAATHVVLPVGQRPGASARPRLLRGDGEMEARASPWHGPAGAATHPRSLCRVVPVAGSRRAQHGRPAAP